MPRRHRNASERQVAHFTASATFRRELATLAWLQKANSPGDQRPEAALRPVREADHEHAIAC